jgi:hypothetical protein
MAKYKVFFSIPAYRDVIVEAETEEEAIRKAHDIDPGEDAYYEIDWDATEEYVFNIKL